MSTESNMCETRSTPAKLAIVIPCYNEEEALEGCAWKLVEIVEQLRDKGKISEESKIFFVDDGSGDRTWELIKRLALKQRSISGIKLSRNMGHQNALLAALFTAPGDALISLDADLQDDIGLIEEMVDHYLKGSDVVYGVRNERRTDTMFKRLTAEAFYLMIRLFGADVVRNHADFRLMSRRAVECLKEFKEVNLFLRGLVRLVGLRDSIVYYERGSRIAGTSKYPLRKMIAFALDGITSFSAVPLRLISWIGFSISFLALIMSSWVLYVKLFVTGAVPGWASTALPIYFIGGVQIMCIGVIGEYLGKVYIETKRRPRFFIEESI